jgi:hypothetical protein
MSVYTVHEPPLRAADAFTDPDRFAFVRDGFYWWAFLLTPFWMLWHRLWMVLVIYLLVSAGLETAVQIVGASAAVIAVVAILISLLVGLEASTLRRFTLKRRLWRSLGIVCGDDVEDAEERFFDAWVREAPTRNAAPSTATPSSPPAPRTSETSGVIGLFPEPGSQR